MKLFNHMTHMSHMMHKNENLVPFPNPVPIIRARKELGI